jgi:GWxTD domain-containing protein
MNSRTAIRPLMPTLLIALLLAPASGASGRDQKPNLPESAKRWLDEDVVYIIAPVEREVFLKLGGDRERDLFIEAFWRQRDPTPGTPENEFKTEHYRRIAYANRYLGRDAPRPGWRTDRGRIYIILGAAMDIQRFEGRQATYDAEIWFYQGKTDLGLPAGFNVVFFKEGGRGEYRLYSPVGDGPQALLAGYYGGGHNYEQAYEKLEEAEPSLAAVSLSLIPGEGGTAYGRPSLSADILIQRIESSETRSVKTMYAQKFLQYKDTVDVEYTANYIDSDSLFKVFLDPSGFWFVHYAVEPRRLSVNQYEDKFYTSLKVNGRISTRDGHLVHQFDKTVSLNLTKEQMEGASRAPFNFQDLFPLLGGDYTLSILIKNETSKEFTSVEQALRIPRGGAKVELTQPLLGYRAVRLEPEARRMKAFRVGAYQITCQPSRIFTRQDMLAVAFQVNSLSAESAAASEIRIEFLKDGQPFRDLRKKPSDYPDLPTCLEEFPLTDFAPAHYAVRVSVWSGGAEVVSATEEFDLSFAEAVPRPWFSSRVLPDTGDPSYARIIGAQLFNLGRFEEALIYLERAFAKMPDSEDTASAVARANLMLERVPAAIQALAPFVETAKTASYETYVLAAEASRRNGEFDQAIGLAERAVEHYGVNSALMNLMGECFTGQGKIQEALAALEKSLSLSPDQPEVRDKIAELKKRK